MATKPTRIPLAQPIQSRSASFASDSYTQNVVFEKKDQSVEIVKRPGLTVQYYPSAWYTSYTPTTFFGAARYRGITSANGAYTDFYLTFGNLSSSGGIVTVGSPAGAVFQNTIGTIGQQVTYTTMPAFTTSGGGDAYIAINTGNYLVYGKMQHAGIATTNSFTIVQDSFVGISIGSIVPGVVYLDGMFIVGTSGGQLYNTDIILTAPEVQNTGGYTQPNITSTNVINTYGDSGPLIGITKHLNYVVAFKAFTTEFYYNAGTPTGPTTAGGPGTPLANYVQARNTIGCVNAYSIVSMQDTIMWIGQSLNFGKSVYIMNGLSPERVSTDYIDKYLDADGCVSVFACSYKYNGHLLYMLNLKTLNVTLAYDRNTNEWFRWSMYNGTSDSYFPMYQNLYSTNPTYPDLFYGIHPISNVPCIFGMFTSIYTDDSQPMYVRSVTNTEDWGTRQPKVFGRLDVVADQQTGSTINISHTDDDFITYSTPRSVDLSQNRPVLFQGGRARKRSYKIEHTANTPFRGEAIELDIKGGS